MLYLDRYPQLRAIAWNRPAGYRLGAAEAFALYERNWRHVEQDKLTDRETRLIRRLVRVAGSGVMLA